MKGTHAFIIVVGIVALFLVSSGAFAQEGAYSCEFADGTQRSVEEEGCAECLAGGGECVSVDVNLAERAVDIYNWSLGIGAITALAIIIYGGVIYTTSAGNPSRMDNAKKWIWAALGGLALLFSSFIIINVINPDLTNLKNPLDAVEVLEQMEAELVEVEEGDTFVVGLTEDASEKVAEGGVRAFFDVRDKEEDLVLMLSPGENIRNLAKHDIESVKTFFGGEDVSLDDAILRVVISANTAVQLNSDANFGGPWLKITTDELGNVITCKKLAQQDEYKNENVVVDCLERIKLIGGENGYIDLGGICINEDDNRKLDGELHCYEDFIDRKWLGVVSSIKVSAR